MGWAKTSSARRRIGRIRAPNRVTDNSSRRCQVPILTWNSGSWAVVEVWRLYRQVFPAAGASGLGPAWLHAKVRIMYRNFFGLHRLPFEGQPDVRFFSPTADQKAALDLMRRTAAGDQGPVLITGSTGLGKTAVCRALLAGLEKGAVPVLHTCGPNDSPGLISMVGKAVNLEINPEATLKHQAGQLKKFIAGADSGGHRHVLLVLDRVEHLAPEAFTEIDQLCDLRDGDRALVRIVMVGRRTAIDKLKGASPERLSNRLAATHELQPMTVGEVGAYIVRRLSVAGLVDKTVFDPQAVELIHQKSGGSPRRVNRLCRSAMRAACDAGCAKIDAALVEAGQDPSTGTSESATGKGSGGAPEEADPSAARTQQMLERMERMLADGAALNRRMEQALQTAEAAPSTAAADAAAAAAREVEEASQRLASFEERIATSCARAEQVSRRLEDLMVTGAECDQKSAAHVESVQAACTQAAAVRSELSAYAERLADVGLQTQQRVTSLAEEFESEGGIGELLTEFVAARDELADTVRSASERSAGIRQELDEAVKRQATRAAGIHEELSTAIRETTSQCESASEGLNEEIKQNNELRAEIRAEIEQGVRELEQHCGKVSEQLDDALGSASQRVQAIRTELDGAIDGAGEQTADVREGLGEVIRIASERVSGLGVDLNGLIRGAAEQTTGLREELDGAIETAEQGIAQARLTWQDARDEADEAAARTREEVARIIQDSAEQSERAREDLAETIRDAGERYTSVRGELNEALEAMTKRFSGASDQFDEVLSKAAERSATIREQLEAVAEKSAEQSASIRQDLEGVLSEAAEGVSGVREQVQTEIAAADQKTEQLASLVRAAREATRQAGSVVSDAHSVADRLMGKVTDGRSAAELIEHQLQAGINDAGSSIDGLTTAIDRAGTTAEELQSEVGQAGQKAGQLASLTHAAQAVARQITTNTTDAHAAADTLAAKMSDLEVAVDQIDQRATEVVTETQEALDKQRDDLEALLAASKQATVGICEQIGSARDEARQDIVSLESARASAAESVADLDKRVLSAESSCERIGQLTHDLWSLSSTAEDRARQLGSIVGQADATLSGLRKSADEAAAATEGLSAQTKRAQDASGTIEARFRQGMALDERLVAHTATAGQAQRECEQQADAARKTIEQVSSVVQRGEQLKSRLAEGIDSAERTAKRLGEQRDASRATLQRQQTMHDQDRKVLTELEEHRQVAADLIASLSKLSADGAIVADRLAVDCDRAARNLAEVGEQVEAMDSRKEIVVAAERTLNDFIGHAEGISQQIEKLQRQADGFEVHVSRMLDAPEAVVAEAKTQSAQLQGVCRAVRKVFAGLSQATIEANKRIEQFQKTSQAAENRANRLSVETNRAAETLRTWVSEAVRVQSRLAASIERSPKLDETHPSESLRRLASMAPASGRALGESDKLELPVAALSSEADPAAAKRGMIGGCVADARTRADEISQLLEDARTPVTVST